MCAKMVSMTLEYPEPELLDELRLEFGDKGQRAIEFLTTAHMFLQFDEDSIPRLGPAVAYCLREAMTSVLGSVVIAEEDTLNDVADRVIKARDNYRQAANLPGGDAERAFGDLLERISDLEDVRGRERWNQRRLIAVMVDRTGAEPLSSGTRPVRAYQSLLVRLNDALHGSRPDVGAAQLWSVCIAIFRQLFIPPQTRFSELESFARIALPHSRRCGRCSSAAGEPATPALLHEEGDESRLAECAQTDGPFGSTGCWSGVAGACRRRATR